MTAADLSTISTRCLLLVLVSGMALVAASTAADGCTSCQSPFPLTAGFIGTPSSGGAPLTVQFLDTTTQFPDTWSWNFGDGTTSREQNPVHTYQAPGTYHVSLTASKGRVEDLVVRDEYIQVTGTVLSASATKTPNRVATPAPKTTPVTGSSGSDGALNAEFNVKPTSGTAPLSVTFTDRSSGSITTRVFDFGDGTNSTARDPVHIYTQPGKYTVTLFISGPGGASVKQLINGITVREGAAATVKTPSITKNPAPTRTIVPQKTALPAKWTKVPYISFNPRALFGR
jgi:PKD repeat protein